MHYFVELITTYKYFVLFPLAVVEGPIVALVAGFLVYTGILSAIPTFIIMLFGDIIPDYIYYYVGIVGDKKHLVEKYSAKSKILSKGHPILVRLWEHHPAKTMFLAKLAYGLSIPFLISAGLVKMSPKKFFIYSVPATIFQYGIIMIIGFALGGSYEIAARYIKDAGIIVAVILTICVIGYIMMARYARKKIIEYEEHEN